MEFYLERVKEDQKEILYRLLQYMLYEMSEYETFTIEEDGHFKYKYFDLYFKEENRDAYFIKEEKTNKLLGFAMVNTYMQIAEKGHSIAEYLILPQYRRKNIGRKVAKQLFNNYEGTWEIKPAANERAYLFWKRVIEEYTNNHYTFQDNIFLFSSLTNKIDEKKKMNDAN